MDENTESPIPLTSALIDQLRNNIPPDEWVRIDRALRSMLVELSTGATISKKTARWRRSKG